MNSRVLPLVLYILFAFSCSNLSEPIQSDEQSTQSPYQIQLEFERIEVEGLDPFWVRVELTNNGIRQSNKSLQVEVPRGRVSELTDHKDGTYSFVVTPDATGIYPVSVSYQGATVRREALVVNQVLEGLGQPQLVAGLVNTPGYEDGITITPDGEYLFIQYGPLYFSGIILHSSICAEEGWSLYDLTTCGPKADSPWVFSTIGPTTGPYRPGFPTGGIRKSKLTHIDLRIPGVANKIVLFPTTFYGFRRQPDGSFAEPFKVGFQDKKGTNGPFGLSFQMTGPNTAQFLVAWNNYFDDLGDDKPDVYYGALTLGQETSLGEVKYEGEFFQSISPQIRPLGFESHGGVQGNPHHFSDSSGSIRSIWVDDEQDTHDLRVYGLSSGDFPDGSWSFVDLPSPINTADAESQPFFTGSRLFLNREVKIVYHDYWGPQTLSGYADPANWGQEVVVLGSGDLSIGGIFGVGEPSLAQREGKTLLYFAYVEARSAGSVPGRIDYDLGVGYVDISGLGPLPMTE